LEKNYGINCNRSKLWADSGFCRQVLTVTGTDIVPGTLLDADGVATVAADVVGIAMQEASGTDVKVLALVKGPAIVSKAGLVLNGLTLADVVAVLEAKGIACNDAV
jgi:hypothetical protein